MLRMLCLGALLVGCRRGGGTYRGGPSSVTPRTDDERTLYAMGMIVGQRLSDFHLNAHELDIVQRGMRDEILHQHALVDLPTFGPRIQQFVARREAAQAQIAHQEGQAFLDRAAHEAGAQRFPSGMVFRELQPGTGPSPSPSDEVTVNYRGTLIDGTQFDSSYDRHQPATFRLDRVIPCWTEGVQHMHVGGRARMVCPANLAYGDRGQSRIPPGSTLVFEIELVGTHPSAPPQPMQLPMMSPPTGPTAPTSNPLPTGH